LLAVVGAVVVAINNRPPPSPQDVLRRAFDEETLSKSEPPKH
jgi:hypothetical protein